MPLNAHRLRVGDRCFVEHVLGGQVPVCIEGVRETPRCTHYRCRVLEGRLRGAHTSFCIFYSGVVSRRAFAAPLNPYIVSI